MDNTKSDSMKTELLLLTACECYIASMCNIQKTLKSED